MHIRLNLKTLAAMTRIDRLEKRLVDPAPALQECGLVLLRSIARNFAAGGRPVRWKPSHRAQVSGGKTLIKTARLKNAMTMKVTRRVLRVGTNVKYAAIHQFGGRVEKNVRVKSHYRVITRVFGKRVPARRVLVGAHQRRMNFTVPARPFLMVQDEDMRVFKQIIGDYLRS